MWMISPCQPCGVRCGRGKDRSTRASLTARPSLQGNAGSPGGPPPARRYPARGRRCVTCGSQYAGRSRWKNVQSPSLRRRRPASHRVDSAVVRADVDTAHRCAPTAARRARADARIDHNHMDRPVREVGRRARQDQRRLRRIFCGLIWWVISAICTWGAMRQMTPFITPT